MTEQLNNDFEVKATQIKTLTVSPSNEELLELYALYKQATSGNNNTDRPSFIYVKECAKWNAWESKKKMHRDKAKYEYILLVNNLMTKYTQ